MEDVNSHGRNPIRLGAVLRPVLDAAMSEWTERATTRW